MKTYALLILILAVSVTNGQSYFTVAQSPKGLKYIEVTRVNLLAIAMLPLGVFKEQCIKEGFQIKEQDGCVAAIMGSPKDVTKGSMILTKCPSSEYADVSIFCVQTNLNYENVPFQKDITLDLLWNGFTYYKADGFDIYSMVNEKEKLRMVLKLSLETKNNLLMEEIIFDLFNM